MKIFPRAADSNSRVFISCLLSFITVVTPIAYISALDINAAPLSSLSVAKTHNQGTVNRADKLERKRFTNSSILTVPTPSITATKTASTVDANGNGKLDLGEDIDYTVKVSNAAGGSDA